jgi:hypothetical protein
MSSERKLIRLDVKDFLEMRPLDEVAKCHEGESQNFTLMGICFSSQAQWKRGQVLLIDYFIPTELDSVKMKVVVKWAEFIGPEKGHFCGGEIIEVEEKKEEKFANYYYQKLKERFI